MSAPEPLAVGMYITATGGTTGRIVDRVLENGVIWWIIKTTSGNIFRARSSKLTPRESCQ